MTETSKDQRPTLPKASQSIVLRRDRKLERELREISAGMREEAEREEQEGRAVIPTFRFLHTIVRKAA